MESVWVTLFMCFACYAYNRKIVSLVSPKLIEDGLDQSHVGMILSCQNGAFAISKFIAGVLSDRTNPRHVFIVGLLVGAIATVLFSTVPTSSILILCGLWFLNGLAQGCGWPSCAKIIRQRASPTQFGTLWSVLSSSNNVAGSLSPFISSYIVLHYGWRASVFTSGIISLLFALLGAFALKFSVGNEETCKSSNKKKCKDSGTNSSLEGRFLDLLLDPFLIMLSASFLVVLGARTALATWGQLYLIEERGRSQYEGSAFASSIESGGLLGRITVGYVTDRLIQLYTLKDSSPLNVRLSVAVGFMLGSIPLLHALRVTVTEDSSTVWITFLGFMIGVLLYGPISIIGIVSVESAPTHLSGSSNAIVSLAGNRLILSCQNGAFALSKFIVGVLSDKTNPRHVFIFGLLLSAAATLAFSSAPVSSISVLCGLWFLNGLAQGCGWPSCAKIIRQRASPSQFGTLWSVLSSGNNFSGSLSPFISSYIVLHYGWRTSVFTAGCASVVLGILGAAALKYSLGTDEKTSKEHEKITQQNSSKEGKAATDGSIIDLLLDPFLIMVSAGYFMVFCARSVLLDWGQLYLIEDRGRSHHEGSAFASSLETGGFLGQIAAGFITDKLINLFTGSSQSSVRLSVAVLSMLGSVSLLHALQVTVTEESSTAWITSLGFALGASLYGPIAIFGIVSTESAPAHLSGKSNAVAALAANLGAMTSGFPCCYLAKHYSWSTVFFILEVITGVLLLIIFCFRNLQPKLLKKEAHKKEE